MHPSDGPHTIAVEKVTGPEDYRAWRRTMELTLACKRKLGFVTGPVKRDEKDPVKQDLWDTFHSMVVAWLNISVSDQIRKSIFYFGTARDIWVHLEACYNPMVQGSLNLTKMHMILSRMGVLSTSITPLLSLCGKSKTQCLWFQQSHR